MRDPKQIAIRRLRHIEERLQKGLDRIRRELARYEHPSDPEKSSQRPTS